MKAFKVTIALKSMGSVLIIISALFTASYVWADDPDTTEPVIEIRTVPEFEPDMDDILQEMKRRFPVQGTLDALYDDRVVVGDTTIFLDDNCEMNRVREGEYVGVRSGENEKALEIVPIEAPAAIETGYENERL